MNNTIYRGTDLIFDIILSDKKGYPFRVKDTTEFIVEFFTDDCCRPIQCTYSDGNYEGIAEGKRIDKIIINSSDLEKLKSGVLKYAYKYKFPSPYFEDEYYDETGIGTTNYYIQN